MLSFCCFYVLAFLAINLNIFRKLLNAITLTKKIAMPINLLRRFKIFRLSKREEKDSLLLPCE